MHDRKLSKFLSLILRHKPEKLGVTLDDRGWASVPEILQKMNERGMAVDLARIVHVVNTNDKQRFRLSEDRQRIRANQGHSIPIKLDLSPQAPPEWLFHGTATKNLASIREKGLLKGRRQHVHLSWDEETAVRVGQRHGKPVVLKIQAGRMQQDGFVFYLSDNKVWLTDRVPASYIEGEMRR